MKKPEDYPHSSYVAFITTKSGNLVYRDLIWEMISRGEGEAPKRYKAFVEGVIGKSLDSPLEDVYGGAILGNKRFIKEALSRFRDEIFHKEEISHRRELQVSYGFKNVIKGICEHFEITRDEVMRKGGDYRKMAIYLLKKFTGMTNQQIGELFGGLTYSAVAKTYERFSSRLEEDSSLRKKPESILRILSKVKG